MIRMMASVALAVAAMASASPGLAQDANRTTVAVRLVNDFSKPAEVRDAYRRLYAAVQKACWSEGAGPQWRRADDLACEEEAMDGVVSDLGQPQLTRLYNQVGVDADRIAALQVRSDTELSR